MLLLRLLLRVEGVCGDTGADCCRYIFAADGAVLLRRILNLTEDSLGRRCWLTLVIQFMPSVLAYLIIFLCAKITPHHFFTLICQITPFVLGVTHLLLLNIEGATISSTTHKHNRPVGNETVNLIIGSIIQLPPGGARGGQGYSNYAHSKPSSTLCTFATLNRAPFTSMCTIKVALDTRATLRN